MTQKNPQTTIPRRLSRTQRRLRVLELSVAGVPYYEIAAELNVSAGTVYNDLNAVLKELSERTSRETAEYRLLEAQRLDELQAAAWEKALSGNLSAIEAVLGIMNRRAKLLGLDQPVKVDLTAEIDFHISQILQVLERVLPREHFKTALEALAEAA